MEEKKFCPYCGEKLQGKSVFCGKCGNRITALSDIAKEVVTKEPETKGRRKYIVIAIIVICIFAGIFARTNSAEYRIVGTWTEIGENERARETTFVFYEDGTLYNDGVNGNYVFGDGTITMSLSNGWDTYTETFQYKMKGKQLILTYEETGDSITLRKQ